MGNDVDRGSGSTYYSFHQKPTCHLNLCGEKKVFAVNKTTNKHLTVGICDLCDGPAAKLASRPSA